MGWTFRCEKSTHGFKKICDRFVVAFELTFELQQLFGEFAMGGEEFSQLHERANEGERYAHRAVGMENAGEQGDALLGEYSSGSSTSTPSFFLIFQIGISNFQAHHG